MQRILCDVCFRDNHEGADDIKFSEKHQEFQCIECRHSIAVSVFRSEEGYTDPLIWPQVLANKDKNTDEPEY